MRKKQNHQFDSLSLGTDPKRSTGLNWSRNLTEVRSVCPRIMEQQSGAGDWVTNGGRYFFVLNFAWEPREINLQKSMIDMDPHEAVSGRVTLEAFGTRVYKFI